MSAHSHLEAAYKSLCKKGVLKEDVAQKNAIIHLEELLQAYHQRSEQTTFSKLFSSPKELKGFYIYGSVGRGKTLLMDLFFKHLKTPKKKRVHFHAFMQSLHEKLHKQNGEKVDHIASNLAKEFDVLCLDEFFIDHIGDAMLISKFLGVLFEKNVLILTTSNCAPDDLYKGGFQRELFLPFITTLKEKTTTLFLGGETDYRQDMRNHFPHLVLEREMGPLFKEITGVTPMPQKFTLEKRTYHAEGVSQDTLFCSFEELCIQPRGARDYLNLFSHFSNLFLKGIPLFNAQNKEAAKRFQNLIDVVYDKKITLWGTLEAHPLNLFNESYETSYERTSSRLLELLAAKKE